MIIQCSKCGKTIDDADQTTVCPHGLIMPAEDLARKKKAALDYVDIPVDALLGRDSAFFQQPWPDVTLKAISVLKHYQSAILSGRGGRVIRANAPPFQFILNASPREVRLDGDKYAAGELAFRRDGAKVAAINFMAGPHGVLHILLQDGAALLTAHRREKARQIEDEIIEALTRESARLAGAP